MEYLASVGKARLLQRDDNGNLKLFANANTLTDSAFSFTSSMEEVRAGQGGKLYGRFNHSTGMTVQLTDVMFNADYIAAQIGAQYENIGSVYSKEEGTNVPKIDDDGYLVVGNDIQPIGQGCGLNHKMVWFVPKGNCNGGAKKETLVAEVEKVTGKTLTYSAKTGYTLPTSLDDYCVYYYHDNDDATTLKVLGAFNPKELVLIVDANLYSGDSNNAAESTVVGSVRFTVPRFQLDGTFDLSMAMTSASTMSLNGTALIAETNDCEGEGYYAEITVERKGSGADSALHSIAFDDGDRPIGDFKDGEMLSVIGTMQNGRIREFDGTTGVTFAVTSPESGGKVSVTSVGKITKNLSGTLPVKITATKDGKTADLVIYQGVEQPEVEE